MKRTILEESFSITILPQEVWIYIFDFLPREELALKKEQSWLLEVMASCKIFYTSFHHQKILKVDGFSFTGQKCCSLLERFPFLEHLIFYTTGYSSTTGEKFELPSLPRLHTLEFFRYEKFDQIIPLGDCLRIDFSSLERKKLPSLEKLFLGKNTVFTDYEVASIPRALREKITTFMDTDQGLFYPIKPILPNIRHIIISDGNDGDDNEDDKLRLSHFALEKLRGMTGTCEIRGFYMWKCEIDWIQGKSGYRKSGRIENGRPVGQWISEGVTLKKFIGEEMNEQWVVKSRSI